MKAYSIVELHEKFKEDPSFIKTYYEELFDALQFQQDRLNAFVTITKEEAMKRLETMTFDPDNMLSMIPVVYKDNYSTKGVRTTASSRMLENYVPVYNATAVNKLNQQGTVMVGKSSMDELAMGGTNKSALTGPVANPWNTKCIAGGSSGGSAALVGSGVVPFATGSDTGDSIRKPAGFCGVVGFKPTWGRISRFGVIPYASSLDHLGAFTRTVEDMAIVIEAMAGRDDHDMTSSYREVEHYYANLSQDVKGLKIAVLKNVYDQITNPDVKEAFDQSINIYRELGAVVDEVSMDQNLLLTALPVYTIIANSEATSNHSCLDGIKYGLRVPADSADGVMIQSRTAGFGAHIKRRFVLGNLALATENQEKMFRKAQRVRRLIVEELNRIYEDYDLIVTPVSNDGAPTIEDAKDDRLSSQYVILENNLVLGNFAGTPSLSLPIGKTSGMPVNINLMGRLFEEQTVLNAGYALQEHLPFKNQFAGGEE